MKAILFFAVIVLIVSCNPRQEKSAHHSLQADSVASSGQKDAPIKTVYITIEGDKYHTADCRYAEGGRAVKITKARSNGKKACAVCKPNSDKDQKRCSAKTIDGAQCQRMTANASRKCFQHENKN